MKDDQKNLLGLDNKQYTIEEFGDAIRSKFGADKTISNVILGEMFLATYPIYSCKIKKSKNHFFKLSLIQVGQTMDT
jgi:hypothetical protein